MNTNINEAQHKLAIELSNAIDESVDNAVSFVAQAKSDYQGGPLKVLVAMKMAYSDEQMAQFPKVGSGKEKDYQGNNPDYYKVPSFGKDGKLTEKLVSFYVEFADNTPSGKNTVQALDWLSRAANDKAKQDDIPADIKKLNPHQREVERARLEGRRNTIRSSYKAAIKLHYQFEAINALQYVEAVPIPGVKEGEFENVVLVRSTVPGRETMDFEHYSLSAFIRLDADKAAEKGGTLAALKETAKRAQEPEGGGTGTTVNIKTFDTYRKVINDVHAFMNEAKTAKDKAKYTDLLKVLGPRGGAGSDLFALSMYQVYNMLGDIYRHDDIRARAEALNEADLKKAA